jgi:hypothetical protein
MHINFIYSRYIQNDVEIFSLLNFHLITLHDNCTVTVGLTNLFFWFGRFMPVSFLEALIIPFWIPFVLMLAFNRVASLNKMMANFMQLANQLEKVIFNANNSKSLRRNDTSRPLREA